MSSVFDQPWTGRHLIVPQRLRQRRDELGLTQKQVVTRLGRLGILTSNRALSSLEHGAGLDIAKLPELATVLDCTVTYLLGLTDDPHRWAPDRVDAGGADAEAPAAVVPVAAAPAAAPAPPASQAPDAGRRPPCILGTNVPERVRRYR